MFLFLISLLLVFSFAFFTANIIECKNVIRNLIYIFLCVFANIVFTFEVLSLFSKISIGGVLLLNALFAGIFFVIWLLRGRPLVTFNIKSFLRKLTIALRLDKSLLFLLIGVLFLLVTSVFLGWIFPAEDAASLFYHVARAVFWLEQGNFNHFSISDARNLCFPINSEILYTWVMLFLRKNVYLNLFSVGFYMLYTVALYGILSKLTSALRPKLWVIFIVSSFTAVITYLSSTETNIIIAALFAAAIYLMMSMDNDKSDAAIYMSSLAVALAIGVKTSALFLLPAVFVWYIAVGVRASSNNLQKIIVKFGLFLALNILLFSAYNYILNFMNYGNFFSIKSLSYSHQNQFGFEGLLFNFLNYFVMMFNFSELDKFYNSSVVIFEVKKYLFNVFSNPLLLGHYSNESYYNFIGAGKSGLGLLGVILFLPCLIYSFVRLFFTQNKKEFLIASFSIIYIVAFICMTYSLVYMSFNIRFIVTFALVSAPVIYFSYRKKSTIYKIIVSFFALFSFFYISLNITNMNVFPIIKYFQNGGSIRYFRSYVKCSGLSFDMKNPHVNAYCKIRDYIKSQGKQNKFLYFSQEGEGLLFIKELYFEGYSVDVDLIENSHNIDFSKYDFVITLENRQISNLFRHVDDIKGASFSNDGIYCNYNDISGRIILQNSDLKPYISLCRFDDNFFTSKGFYLFDTLIIAEDFARRQNSYKYYVYKSLKSN